MLPEHRAELEHAARHGDWHCRGHWQHATAKVHPSSILFAGAVIGPDVTIGADCVIGPNASIGQPGFGYTAHDDGRQEYRTHTKGVTVEQDVHIGACATIDQGRHRPTVIRTGTRIDNSVHVGHNALVGRRCVLVAHAMIGGSAELKDLAYIAPGALICDHVTIGTAAMVGLGAVVRHDVPAGETWAGVPARKIR